MPASHPRTRTAAAASFAAALVLALSGVPAGASAPEDGPEPATPHAAQAESTQPSSVEADDHPNLHPSGKDRSVEPGGSGEQGDAGADPDDDGRGPDRSNGGLDQAGGEGGVYEHDRDGNNGCGNDDDFEDDNEGRCLGRDGAPGQQPDVEGAGVEAPDEDEQDEQDEQDVVEQGERVEAAEVLAEELTAGPAVAPVEAPSELTDESATGADAPAADDIEVLGVSVTRDATPTAAGDTTVQGELPRTGAGLGLLAGMGALVVAAGTALVRSGRTADA